MSVTRDVRCVRSEPHDPHEWWAGHETSPLRCPGVPATAAPLTRADVHREVVLAQLAVAREALYQALLWSILPAGQGSILTGPQAESLAFAKNSAGQLQREVQEDRRG